MTDTNRPNADKTSGDLFSSLTPKEAPYEEFDISKFDFTIATCCSNGDEAYFPTQQAFDEGGYEVVSTDFAAGTAEQIVFTTLGLINSL